MTRRARLLALGGALGLAPALAAAQFNMVPPPQCPPPATAASETEEAYRLEATRHIYDCFPGRVYLGVLPPLVYGVITVQADIDANGQIARIDVLRKPIAEEIEPWMLALLRRVTPFPAPVKLPGRAVRLVETFFVDRSGLFQAHSLTEGQKSILPGERAAPLTTASPLAEPTDKPRAVRE